MTEADQNRTLGELIRDAIAIADAAAAATTDPASKELYEKTRLTLGAALTGLDDFASRAVRNPA